MKKSGNSASTAAPPASVCPCGGIEPGLSFDACCGRYLTPFDLDPALPGSSAPTPQALMRSRYSAFVLGKEAYLLASWHASTRPPIAHSRDGAQWLGLEVKRHSMDGDAGTVEFVARYKLQGRAHRLHEVSRFVRENGHWYYLDGEFPKNQA